MPLQIKLCCDGCGKSFELAELERLTNAYRVLSRPTRRALIYNTCEGCGRRVHTTVLEENYKCNTCKILVERATRRNSQKSKKSKEDKEEIGVVMTPLKRKLPKNLPNNQTYKINPLAKREQIEGYINH